MAWTNILLVGMGGGLGSIARFLCQKYIYEWKPHAFPFGTLVANIAGCFIIGLFFGLMEKGHLLSQEWRLLIATGFCGGFTTFSSFSAENIQLLKNGQLFWFMLYTGASIVLGLLATWIGIILGK